MFSPIAYVNRSCRDYDPDTLLPNLPKMVTFPKLHEFYKDWQADLENKGVKFRFETDVEEILDRNDETVTIKSRRKQVDGVNKTSGITDDHSSVEQFDELVLCVLADDALKLLGRTASWQEKFVLGGAKFYDDITITHSDSKYFQKHYETEFKEELCAKPTSKQQEEQIAFAKGEKDMDGSKAGFRPMYYTKSYAEDPKKIEMSFDASNYQHQLRKAADPGSGENLEHVYQTIFLDKNNKHLWTIDEIDENKIICRKWWHQLGHRKFYYLFWFSTLRYFSQVGSTISE